MCLRDLDVKESNRRWEFLFTAVFIIQCITSVLGLVSVILASCVLKEDKDLTLAGQNLLWVHYVVYEKVCLAVLCFTALCSIGLVSICALAKDPTHLFKFSINITYHGFGTLLLLMTLIMKTHSAVRMEVIQSILLEQYLKNLTKGTHAAHSDDDHPARYTIKAVVAGLILINLLLFVDIVIRLLLKRKYRPPDAFMDDYRMDENGLTDLDQVKSERDQSILDQVLGEVREDYEAEPVYSPAITNRVK